MVNGSRMETKNILAKHYKECITKRLLKMFKFNNTE